MERNEAQLEGKPALLGAAAVCCGIGIVEGLLAVGWAPLGPLGWPGLVLVTATVLWGGSAALGGTIILFAYLLFTLGEPQRFPHFFANPGMLGFWFIGLGLTTMVAASMRGRLLQARALALKAAQIESEMTALIGYRNWLCAIVDNAPTLIGYIDAEQRFQFHNVTYEHWLEKPKAEITGRTVREVFGEAEYPKIKPHLERALRGGRVTFHHEHWLHGEVRHAQTSFTPDYDRAGGRVLGCFVATNDIGSVIGEQRELRAAQQRYELALGGSSVELWDADLKSGEVHLGESLTSAPALAALVHPDDRALARASLRAALKGLAPTYVSEYRLRTADGGYRWVLSRGRVTQRDPASGRALRMIGANVDIHERKLAEQAIERRSHEDPAGGIATPSLLGERLRRALARAQRSGAPFALMQIEIGGVREGDDGLTMETASRLRRCVRLTDTVARTGTGKFVVLLEGLKERGDAFRVAEKMLQVVRQPLKTEGGEIQLTASIGVAFPEDEAATPEELVKRAGSALSEAKGAGRDAYRVGKARG